MLNITEGTKWIFIPSNYLRYFGVDYFIHEIIKIHDTTYEKTYEEDPGINPTGSGCKSIFSAFGRIQIFWK
jgi:hypothetical protein